MKTANAVSERRLAIDELDHAIVSLSARINAANYELLVLVREFDERAGFLRWGMSNCSEWLHWRCDLSPTTAREKVRVAHALKSLPEISVAFAAGELSYSKVRALTRVATPASETMLLGFAMTTTAARVEERCRQLHNVKPEAVAESNRVYQKRSLRVWRDPQRGTMTITVELPVEDGELISHALDKAVESKSGDGAELEPAPWCAQQADALIDISSSYLRNSDSKASTADHYQVVIHVDSEALTQGTGRSDLPLESVRRLSCDGSVLTMINGANGEPLSVGRKQRTIPNAIRRALWARDRHCSFPGCRHTRFVDAHHVIHWSRGGETCLENLLLLCTQHHRLVHEGGYSIHKDVDGLRYFKRPDGRAIPAHGYRPEDMTDDDIGIASQGIASHSIPSNGIATHSGDADASAEASPSRVATLPG